MTSLVMEILANADDFITTDQVAFLTARTRQDAWKTLQYLRRRKAVDVIVEQGIGYWFATVEEDNRSWSHQMRVKEETRKFNKRAVGRKHTHKRAGFK